jgi:BolA protein
VASVRRTSRYASINVARSRQATGQTTRPALTGRSGSRYVDAMARRDLIAEKLTKAFAPASLDVVDESDRHTGHAGHREGGETHFRVHIVAEAFRGKSRLERHRMINETLVGELEGGVHALAIHASAPGERGVAVV